MNRRSGVEEINEFLFQLLLIVYIHGFLLPHPPAPFYFAKSCFHFKDINSSSHSKTFSPIRHLPFSFMVLFLWYIDLSNFYTVQSIHLLPVACLFDKSLQYPDQRSLFLCLFHQILFGFISSIRLFHPSGRYLGLEHGAELWLVFF